LHCTASCTGVNTAVCTGSYPARSTPCAADSEDPAVIVELPYSASGCFDGWASAKAGIAIQVS
jgi:hypothetical protein